MVNAPMRMLSFAGTRSSTTMADQGASSSLQFQLASLQSRIKELEIENSKLASRLSNCRCQQIDDNTDHSVCNGVEPVGHSKELKHGGSKRRETSFKGQIMHAHPRRYVVLKIMYFGKRFYGFASEAQMEPTVESELFKAFERTRLLIADREGSQYSRCGRTDKGVSAAGQVVALYLRSKIRVTSDEAAGSSEGEIDYVKVLNKVLPKDIRVIGWCNAPVDFHARFSCFSREYKYFFWRESLDLPAMENAGMKFLGEHDFRNFCKMDAVNVHNYKRRVTSFEISQAERFEGKELWVFKIRGSAFLWHQIRCMVSVLFMVGQGLETADVVDVLLHTERVPKKPQYIMASEIPLVLHSCEFEDLSFSISPDVSLILGKRDIVVSNALGRYDASEDLHVHLQNEWQMHLTEAAIFHDALRSLSPVKGEMHSNESRMKRKPVHVPLEARITEPSYEERRAKLNSVKPKQEVRGSASELEAVG